MRKLLFVLLVLPALSFADEAKIEAECTAFAQLTNTIIMHRINGVPAEAVIPHMRHHGMPEQAIPVVEPLIEFIYNPELQIREASDVAAIVRHAYDECKKKAEEEAENITT